MLIWCSFPGNSFLGTYTSILYFDHSQELTNTTESNEWATTVSRRSLRYSFRLYTVLRDVDYLLHGAFHPAKTISLNSRLISSLITIKRFSANDAVSTEVKKVKLFAYPSMVSLVTIFGILILLAYAFDDLRVDSIWMVWAAVKNSDLGASILQFDVLVFCFLLCFLCIMIFIWCLNVRTLSSKEILKSEKETLVMEV